MKEVAVDLVREGIMLLAGLDPDRAGVLNEVGFNRYDGDFGHKLAETTTWTNKQRHAAWKMLAKYHRQLTEVGIDYSAIPEPPTENGDNGHDVVKKAPPAKLISVSNGQVSCKFPYDPALVLAVKSWAAGGWNPTDRCWRKTITPQVAKGALAFAAKNEFSFDNGAREALETAADLVAAVEASKATTSDFVVDGFERDGRKLRPFQKAAVEYLIRHPKALLCDEPGLGKSIEAMAVLHALDAFPCLIICPASIKGVWERFVKTWLPGKLVSVVKGKPAAKGADVVILNYDLIWSEKYKWLHDYPWKGLICDEAHAIKSRDAKRSKAVWHSEKVVVGGKEQWVKTGLATGKSLKAVLLLTGTPVLNRPSELIMLLNTTGTMRHFGGSWKFLNRYTHPVHNGWGYDFSGSANEEELHEKLREVGYVRRTKDEVLPELPPIQLETVPIQIDNWSEYDAAEVDVVAYLAANKGLLAASAAARAEALVKIGVLRQIAARGKLQAVKEWINDFLESGKKLVVFADHIAIQKALLVEFKDAAHVMGEDKPEERTRQVDKFQTDPKCRLMIASLTAGSEGLTMTAASHCVMVELGWNPARMEQAASRIHRIGQTASSVNVYYMIGEQTIDEDGLVLLAKKAEVIDAVTDGKPIENVGVFKELVSGIMKRRKGMVNKHLEAIANDPHALEIALEGPQV